MCRAKLPNVENSNTDKQAEKNTSAKTVMIGTKELEIKEPIVGDNRLIVMVI